MVFKAYRDQVQYVRCGFARAKVRPSSSGVVGDSDSDADGDDDEVDCYSAC